MQLTTTPLLAEPPREADVAIVGAGAAGIAAARRCLAAGLIVAVVEGRPRVGGRAVTAPMRGHAVDLGAHWLHCGPANPLVRLGHERGEPLRRAALDSHLFIRGTPARRDQKIARGRAFDRADRALTHAAKEPQDRPAASALPLLGPWAEPIATVHGLVSGRALREVSLRDFPTMHYADNRFIAGGLGAYLARLASGLPVRLGASVRTVDWSEQGVRIQTDAGTLRACVVIVTVPPIVLQRDAIRFTPKLPVAMSEALHGFVAGVYEHVVLHWPNAPFRGRDRLAALAGTHHRPPGMLTRIDNTPFHYFELDHPTAAACRGRDARARFARRVLADHFGHRALTDLSIPAATDWASDPFSGGSWSVVPPGLFGIREALKPASGGRLWFAGEALSRAQWGTVGGAWQEGERAAEEAIAALRNKHRRTASTC